MENSHTDKCYLPIVDEVGVEWFRTTYSSRAIAPRRMKEDRASVSGADDHGVWTAVVEVPRPRMRTVVGQRGAR